VDSVVATIMMCYPEAYWKQLAATHYERIIDTISANKGLFCEARAGGGR
jgi:hypothetical protein